LPNDKEVVTSEALAAGKVSVSWMLEKTEMSLA